MLRDLARALALVVGLAASAGAEEVDIVAIDSRTLTFEPSRDDLTVETVWLNVYSSSPSDVRLDGVALTDAWHHIALAPVARNRFALPGVRIERRAGLLCLSIKVWFAEVGNQHDALFYERVEDRYALVSFATRAEGPEWERARPRFEQNRVQTLRELLGALERPFRIALNGRPLPERR